MPGQLRLVQFETDDGLRLNGLAADAGSDMTVVHVHGKGGNFYENQFVRSMYEAYPKRGINFIGFNNRGHGAYVEAYRRGEVGYVGAAVEDLAECVHDLKAAVEFAEQFGPHVALQGHSLGCEKIMYYGLNSRADIPLILLSPCDAYRLQTVYLAAESVEDQVARLASEYTLEGMEWLPESEYGIRVPGVEYHVPVTAAALVGLITGPAFELLRLSKPWSGPLVPNPGFVYLGGRDPLQIDGAEAMASALRERLTSPAIRVMPEGDHQLRRVAPEVIDSICQWLADDAGWGPGGGRDGGRRRR